MNVLKKIYTLLFLLGWFFFPFNDFEGVAAFGEYKSEAGAYFFIIGFLVFTFDFFAKQKISIPYRNEIFKVLLVFLAWCFITVIINYSGVSESYFKHTSGVYRFIRQYISLLIPSFILLIYFWNVILDWNIAKVLYKIRKVLLLCLVFVAVYGFFETLIVVFNINAVRPILDLFDYFPFVGVNFVPGERISSVTFESPSLGNYLITVAGWMFSYILTEKSKYRFIPTIIVLLLTFFSGSRAALIVITLQFAILVYVLYRMKAYRQVVQRGVQYTILVSALLLIINGPKIIKSFDEKIESLNFSDNLTKSVSNQTRFGMQYASIQVFKEHPIAGVGFGQETYYKRFHYPAWAKKNNWEFKGMYENKNFLSFPSSYNMYTRLLAEIGLVGFFIFLWIIYLGISKSKKVWRLATTDEEKHLSLILIISFVGLAINWFQTDFFRQYGFWLCLVILMKLMHTLREKGKIV